MASRSKYQTRDFGAVASDALAHRISQGLETSRGGFHSGDSFSGTAGDDIYNGTSGDDYANGEGGDDTLNGRGGGDYLLGGAGSDTLNGGGDDDIANGGDGNDTLNGQGGTDYLVGAKGSDTLNGGDDDDTLRSYRGSDHDPGGWDYGAATDTLNGGAGNDRLFAGVHDNVDGGIGHDILALSLLGANAGVSGDLSAAFAGGSALLAGGTYTGLEAYSEIDGSRFGDVITLGDAMQGADAVGLSGNGGDDVLTGGIYANNIYGDDGGDTLNGLGGDDVISSGNSDLSPRLAGGWDTGTAVDTLSGGAGDDTLYAGVGDNVDGGAGRDALMLSLAGATSGVSGDLSAALAGGTVIFAGGEYRGLESCRIEGSKFGDTITAGDPAPSTGSPTSYTVIHGNGGNDVLTGGAGASFFSGGDDNDTLNGRGGNDYLRGDIGADRLNGGDGDDNLVSDYITLSPPNEWDNGTAVDTLNGGAGDDTLYAGVGDNVDGGVGYDALLLSLIGATAGASGDLSAAFTGGTATFAGGSYTGLESYSIIEGSKFGDAIVVGDAMESDANSTHAQGVYGNGGDDVVTGGFDVNHCYGGDGNDTLNGLGGNDDLQGDAGNDVIDGGVGHDIMTGGAESDIFFFQVRSGVDRITDFIVGEDKIQIDVNGVTNFADLAIASDGHSGATVSWRGDAFVDLKGVAPASLSASDFHFGALADVAPAASYPDRAVMHAMAHPDLLLMHHLAIV